jgi:beta-lactamase regulating signal transducer with metallopeptidase domain
MFEWLILHTAVVAALALLALALGRLLRLGPAARHALWLVVLVKLLVPPVVYWPWALPLPAGRTPEPASPEPGHPAPAARPQAEEEEEPAVLVTFPGDSGLSSPPEPAPAREDVAPEAAPPGLPGLPALLGLAWLAGGVIVAGVQLVRVVRMCGVLGDARPAPGWLADEAAELAEGLGVRAPQVRVLAGLGSPVVWGLGRARLLWPQGLEEALPEEGRRAVLVHELAHLRRRDHWVGWLLLVGGCVWWWHPLYRLVRRRLAREAEQACDAWVVQALPGQRRAYAEALLEVCRQRSPAGLAALGAAGARRDLERRLVMVMRDEVPCRVSRRMLIAAGLLFALAVPAWTVGQEAPAPVKTSGVERDTTPAPGPVVTPATGGTTRLSTAEVPPGPAAKGAGESDHDKRVRDLEARVRALLKELEALRKESGAKGPKTGAVLPGETKLPQPNPLVGYARGLHRAPGEGETITLTRATYKLPAGKAEAVAKFLKENVKASVLETKADGDNLVVTTTPDIQGAIGQLVLLVQGKRPGGAHNHIPATRSSVYPVPRR